MTSWQRLGGLHGDLVLGAGASWRMALDCSRHSQWKLGLLGRLAVMMATGFVGGVLGGGLGSLARRLAPSLGAAAAAVLGMPVARAGLFF